MPAPPEIWQLRADLGAGADRRPGVDHGAFADPRADIDEARHQHRALGDEGGAAHDRARHGAKTGGAEVVPRPSRRIWNRTLSHHTAPPGAPAMMLHVVEAEGQQHGLLQPLMHDPFAVALLGHAQLAVVEPVERRLDRVAHRALGLGRDLDRCSQALSMMA